MKKAILVLLSMSLVFQSVPYMRAQEPENRMSKLQRLKQTLSRELREYTKCIKRDENCDPTRKKILYTASAIIAILATTALGLTVWKLTRKGKGYGEREEEVPLKRKVKPPSGVSEISLEALELQLGEGEISGEEELRDEPAAVVGVKKPLSRRRVDVHPLGEASGRPVEEKSQAPEFSDEQLQLKIGNLKRMVYEKKQALTETLFGTEHSKSWGSLQDRGGIPLDRWEVLKRNLAEYDNYVGTYSKEFPSLQKEYEYWQEVSRILRRDL